LKRAASAYDRRAMNAAQQYAVRRRSPALDLIIGAGLARGPVRAAVAPVMVTMEATARQGRQHPTHV
jgi:hypothetical protein